MNRNTKNNTTRKYIMGKSRSPESTGESNDIESCFKIMPGIIVRPINNYNNNQAVRKPIDVEKFVQEVRDIFKTDDKL